jgi:hypothetical protein
VPLRLLARAAPFVIGAVAAAIWLRRRQAQRPALPVRAGAVPPPRRPPAEPPRARTGRFDRAPSGRFVREPERRPIDIVTVVDDLLGAPS